LILLDTNVFVWLGAGEDSLGPKSRAWIERERDADGVGICAITPWEISMLVERRKISLNQDTLVWMEAALGQPGIHLLPLSPAIAVDAGRLPGSIHGDPGDRLIIATARYRACPLLTTYRKILAYAAEGHLQAVDARR
jgi:PIN domain nuclease of toxin-antitoxin system